MDSPFSLIGKNILVTGASSGIGKATAIECARAGAQVVISGRNQTRLEETLHLMDGQGHSIIKADLSIPEQIRLLAENISTLDGIVHCAGITKNIPFKFASLDNMEEVMRINFYAPSELTRMLLKHKKIQKGASIVFISSISGLSCSAPASSIYSASKGAVNGLVKGMALDLASQNIRVNTINPGVVETHIFDNGTISQDQLEENKKLYPLKRFGQPQEIGYAAVFLLSPAADWITGSNLVIDGGFTLL